VWQRGVDTDVFNPRHKSAAMRARMSGGHPEDPLLVYVGRLGAEKNTEALKDILVQVRTAASVCVCTAELHAHVSRCRCAPRHALSWQGCEDLHLGAEKNTEALKDILVQVRTAANAAVYVNSMHC
jgi:hypothetical protein